jgi:hypothetical protein
MINIPVIAGYWFSAVALALFTWRAWYIFRTEKEHIFRYIAEGTALITVADFLYGSAHLRANPKLLTGEFFTADTALIFGIFLACQFPAYYWGLVAGHKREIRIAVGLLLFFCIGVTIANLASLLMGSRPLVELLPSGTIHDGAPVWFNLVKSLLLGLLALGAGITFFYQGLIDHAMRQQRLGLGILISGLSGVSLTVLDQALLTDISIGFLAVGVALIILGLFTASTAPARQAPAE